MNDRQGHEQIADYIKSGYLVSPGTLLSLTHFNNSRLIVVLVLGYFYRDDNEIAIKFLYNGKIDWDYWLSIKLGHRILSHCV
jgi:hypothetical protein